MEIDSSDAYLHRDWAGYALAAMFILIGVAIVIAALKYNGGSISLNSITNAFWSNFWSVIGIFFVLWIVSCMFGWIWKPWHRMYRRRYWNDDPKDILRERYARGDISRKEYQEMMKDIVK